MGSSTWIIGILPLLAFVLIDSFFGLKKGLIAAVILAIIEAIWTIVTFGELDQVTLISLILITLMAVLAWKKNSALIFKIQPSLISLIMALWLIISWSINDPLFVAMALKYAAMLPIEVRLSLKNPAYLEMLGLATLTTGIGLAFHAAATALAAYYLSNWWWIAIRGIGFYVFSLGGMFAAKLMFH
ncbi:MAG: hypothetical protein CME71_11915 [Halobacteriovorax sp.]|nr:hypothetical protein [Halobacteriovorax sp.]